MSVINQKEYLKKYLNIGKSLKGEKRKRKKKTKNETCGLKIIDDNDDNFHNAVQEDLLGETEDAPQIVEVIDDRPLSLRIDEKSKSHMWIPIGGNNIPTTFEDMSPKRRDKEITGTNIPSTFEDMSPTRRKKEIIGNNIPSTLEDMSPTRRKKEITGENATTIVRNRKSDKKSEEEVEMLQKKAESEEKYSRWGRGLKQVENAAEKIAVALNEMSKPLARYADDDDLEKYLKEQEREGDPMLAYIRKKKRKQDIEQGKPMKPEYMGEFMPNRFGIRPGHRWDGVDRSNGYEKRWFEVQNSKFAEREETYKWNTEDM